MCELLGLTARRKIIMNKWLETFFSHSAQHPNGWGLALSDDGAFSVDKEQ